ncbi:Pycsar system effector family protein [Flavobacterium helocola]|uniref:Pycsar system effector family protein n=1 Tax=Flavobacterium helocola TaxID=3139139 RepID=A0ABU9I7K5_9FLAO
MEKERLLFCIQRYDHYYDSVNNKSSVFLGLSTFIVGGLTTGYFVLPDLINCITWIYILIGILIVLGILIMIIVIQAAIPHLSNEKNSLHYFGSISKMSCENFCLKSKDTNSDEDELIDLRMQVHQLSSGLKSKFSFLRIAGILFLIQFILFIPLFILIINNLK